MPIGRTYIITTSVGTVERAPARREASVARRPMVRGALRERRQQLRRVAVRLEFVLDEEE